MAIDLYAGIPVDDYPAALAWYEKLFGTPPTFVGGVEIRARRWAGNSVAGGWRRSVISMAA
ncbi:hypothetical protein RB614_28220 [Phytohabitans sp. ZYX-F-186]|uniref:Glyoxalase/fosfomycin resistance/dioxygenase domain-containing protein n=1 Tax=Phytohabitans maris TaxID=3071409 RepID=A0ABU0ZQB4_9ACTN|nr:hypothetical protein [Phytohabitans sp. ZYX-F-186]MDQ7908420.1 hypothetical protein [Phytohabitans sp. ZYX-F-186]